MSTSNNSVDDDDDWLSKDEDQLLKELQTKSKNEQQSEVIIQPKPAYKPQPATSSPRNKKLIPNDNLKKLCALDALDLFLYVFTHKQPFNVLLANQIALNDTKERLRLFVKILAIICELDLRGFQREFLQFFAKEITLLHTILSYIESIFEKSATQHQDEREIEEFIENVQRLLLQAHQAHVFDADGREVLKALRELMNSHVNKPVMKKDTCVEFLKQLNLMHQHEAAEQSQLTELPEIYPTLDELRAIQKASPLSRFITKPPFSSTAEYLQQQMLVLREDFMISLRAFVQDLQTNHNSRSTSIQRKLWRDVRIEYNTAVNAKRHEMLFVKISKEKSYPDLTTLKVGALLCLTTSAEMENLVLATVNYTPLKLLARGYIR